MRNNWRRLIVILGINILWAILYVPRVHQRIADLQTQFYQSVVIVNPFLKIPVSITSYLQLIFWPSGLTLYHSEMFFTNFQFIFRVLICVIILAVTVYYYFRNRRVFFWLALFFVSLSPTFTPWGISWIVAERYVYLGSLGIFVVVALVLNRLSNVKGLRIATYFVFSLILIALSSRTIIRNIDWKNEDNLWIATGKTSPSSHNTHNNLGDVYARHGDLKLAAGEFKKAIEIKPDYPPAYHNLANVYQSMGKIDEAADYYQKAIKLDPNLWQSYQNLGTICYSQRKFDLAAQYFEKAVSINNADIALHNNLGIIYGALGSIDKAKRQFEIVLQLDPNNSNARQNIELIDKAK